MERRVCVAERQVGQLIGKAGCTIKALGEQSGAQLDHQMRELRTQVRDMGSEVGERMDTRIERLEVLAEDRAQDDPQPEAVGLIDDVQGLTAVRVGLPDLGALTDAAPRFDQPDQLQRRSICPQDSH